MRIQSNLRVHSKSYYGELIPNNLTEYDDGLACTVDHTLPCGLSSLARGGWVQAQRHAPYADLDFTDEKVVTMDLFAVALEQKRQIQDIHRHARHYGRDWFPRLLGYGAYGQHLNRLADCFPALLEWFRETGETGETGETASFAGLVDAIGTVNWIV